MDYNELKDVSDIEEFVKLLGRLPHEDRMHLIWLVRGMAMKAEMQAVS